MAKHKSWHGADIKKARKKKLISLKKKLQRA
jgi:lambda repressor-like predicted transcriptional regulator